MTLSFILNRLTGKLLEIVSSSGDNRDNFRPECLTLTPQGVAMANLANEFGPRKMPDCFVVESDGSVVYGTLEELESYLNPEPERPHNCLPDAHFDGDTYDPARDHTRLKRQLGRVFEAVRDGEWHTLVGLEIKTGDPQASISARLRDLRKPKFGGYNVEHRHIGDGQWEYRISGGVPGAVKGL
jgi:hypothetical protein